MITDLQDAGVSTVTTMAVPAGRLGSQLDVTGQQLLAENLVGRAARGEAGRLETVG